MNIPFIVLFKKIIEFSKIKINDFFLVTKQKKEIFISKVPLTLKEIQIILNDLKK